MNTQRWITFWALTLGALSTAQVAEAQRPRTRPLRPNAPPRYALGVNATLIDPVGDFGRRVEFGGGLGLFGLVNFNRSATVGMRFDASWVIYGHERISRPFWDIGRVGLDVTTNNSIASFGLGPQFTLGRGAVRPYLYGTAGFSYFETRSHLSGAHDHDDFASTVNYDDITFSWTGGGGLLIRLSNGRHPVSLDLSGAFVDNGRTEYLRRGDIIDLPGGDIALLVNESETDLVQFRIGISVGLD